MPCINLDLSLAFLEFCDSALDHGLHGIQAGTFGIDCVQRRLELRDGETPDVNRRWIADWANVEAARGSLGSL